MLETWRQDLAHAGRALLRKPAFTALVALTLALGIGANTAIFTVVDAVLLKPLPYRDPEGLVMVWSRWINFDKTWVSEAEVLDYRAQSRTMDEIAAWGTGFNMALTGELEPLSLPASAVTANTFDVFGVDPVAGRVFSPEEDVPDGPDVAMLDEGLWRQVFGADPDVVGGTVQLQGRAFTVVGIVPSSFRLPLEFKSRARTLVWIPVGFNEADPSRGSHGYLSVARLAPGATAEEASRELGVITERLNADGLYPPDMEFTAFAVPVADEIAGQLRTSLAVLFAAVGFLLLIACANVAALFLTRAEARTREITVRAALGAGRGRLLLLLLTESVVLSVVGGVLGLVLAYGGVRALVALAPPGIPRLGELGVDGRVLLFTLALSVATGLVFGTLPALKASRPDLVDGLREDGRTGGGRGRQWARSVLVVAEVALALLLLISAGLLIRSFAALRAIDPGFDAAGVLAVDLSLPQASYPDDAAVIGLYDRLRESVGALAGVEHAGLVRVLPLDTIIGDSGVDIEGRPTEPNRQRPTGDWQVASPGYFEAMGLKLVAGRFFTDEDRADSLPVVAVNERMAEAFWPGEDALGKRLRMGGRDRPWRVVVGVVGNVRHNGIDVPVKTKYYVPDAQFGSVFGAVRRSMTLVVKTSVEPSTLTAAVRSEVRRLDPSLPLTNVRTLAEVTSAAVSQPRFTMLLMGLFAGLALVLAAVGIYGVLAYAVGRRTREIGIRMALGAGRARVRRMVLGQGLALAAVGTVLGILAASAMTRLLAGLLYGVEPLDAWTFAVLPVALLAVASLAVYLPARRATRVDPVKALRYE